MKKVNKILVLFIFILVVSFVAVWEVLQSQWVAVQVSKVATKYIEEVLKAEIEFNNLQFNLFPPGAEVRDIKFSGQKNDVSFKIEAASLGIYFNPFDVFNTHFIVDNIEVNDGRVDIIYQSVKNKNKSKKNNSINLDKLTILKEIPVNRATIKNVNLIINKQSLNTGFLEIRNNRNNLDINGSFKNISLKKIINKDKTLDQVIIKATLDRSIIDIESLKIKSGFSVLEASGIVKNYVSKNISYDIKLDAKFLLNELHSWMSFRKIGVLNKGIAEIRSSIIGKRDEYKIKNEIQLKDFITDFAYGDNAKIKLDIDEHKITFRKFKLKAKQQEIRLVKPFEFYDFATKKFVEEPIIAETKNLKTDNFLRYLRKSLSIIEGDITGRVRFNLWRNKFSFTVEDKAKINELFLKAGENFEIIRLNDFDMEKGKFIVDNGVFLMDMFVKSGDTNFALEAKIGNGEFSLKMPTGYLELDRLEHIAGFKMKGKGMFSFDMVNGFNGLELFTKNDFKGFELQGYKIDKVKADINYRLDKNEIFLKKLNASSGKSKLQINGVINYKTLGVDAKYKIEKLNFNEVKKVLNPLLGKSDLTANEIHGKWDINGIVKGIAQIDKLILNGNLKGKNNYLFNESIDNLGFNFSMDSGVFKISELKAIKSRGQLNGSFFYNIPEKIFSFDLGAHNIPLHDFSYYSKLPLSLRSYIYGKLKGSYKNNNWFIDTDLSLQKSSVFSKKYDDSNLKLTVNHDRIDLALRFLGNRIVAKTHINFDKTKKDKTYFDFKINFPDVKDVLGLFSGVDLVNTDISGNLNYSLYTEFDFFNKKISKLNSNITSFNLIKNPVNVKYKNSTPEINIVDGLIKKWKINIRGRKFYLLSDGAGDFKNDFLTNTKLKFDASMIEIFNNIISKANGNIRGKVVYGRKTKQALYEAFLTSNNMSLTSSFLPVAVTNADMKISFKKNILNIEKFNAQLVSGLLDVKGIVSFDNIIPDVNIRYEFKDAGISVMRKSSMIFSGAGSLIGKNFPYTLSGDFDIKKFLLINELTDLGLSGGGFSKKDIDYLPGHDEKISNQLLNFNLNVVTREPMYIRNSIADMGFTGNLQVLGGEKDPRLSGKINLAQRNNKITFKNTEFNFSKGNVFFTERNSYKNPELDFLASTTINDIKVSAALLGPVQNFDFTLSSDPTLSQSDILSLIVFGYTEDLSNNLSDIEKESMTRAGVGSIIFDSFKINETLKSEFGVQFNLGTEISKSEGNYLSQGSSSGGSSTVNSATKWEVKKKLSDAMSMSVSGTIGNSSTQKQTVNLNYKVNSKVSLEGVYEEVTNDGAEAISDDNSVGADLKWKWTFK